MNFSCDIIQSLLSFVDLALRSGLISIVQSQS